MVHALVSASKANIELSFQMATGIDLAGRDVFEDVQMSVNPNVIDTPPVTAVAKDGIQLIAKARVTVRANIRAVPHKLARVCCCITMPSEKKAGNFTSAFADRQVNHAQMCIRDSGSSSPFPEIRGKFHFLIYIHRIKSKQSPVKLCRPLAIGVTSQHICLLYTSD